MAASPRPRSALMHAMLYRFVECVGSMTSACDSAVSASSSLPAFTNSSALRISMRTRRCSSSGRVVGRLAGRVAGAATTPPGGAPHLPPPNVPTSSKPTIVRIKPALFTSNDPPATGHLLHEQTWVCFYLIQLVRPGRCTGRRNFNGDRHETLRGHGTSPLPLCLHPHRACPAARQKTHAYREGHPPWPPGRK